MPPQVTAEPVKETELNGHMEAEVAEISEEIQESPAVKEDVVSKDEEP